MPRHITPGGVGGDKLAARVAVTRAAERTAVTVRMSCDKCGALPALAQRVDVHTAAVDHSIRFRSHAVTLQTLHTTTYRNPGSAS